MTKLEEKLIELGYEDYRYYWQKTKWINNTFIIAQISRDLKGGIKDLSVRSQKDIDNIQQAFNELQKDLEELRKYESI